MPINYLIFALLMGTVGFLLWYAASSSLRLPVSLQVQFDINSSYFNRILRRRFAGFLIYAVLPCLLLFHWGVLGEVAWSQLGISFQWNGRVRNWLLGLIPLAILLGWLNGKSRAGQEMYPEIRLAVWTPWMLALSAFFWIIYLIGLEFLYRGLVLQALLLNMGNEWAAVLVSASLYAMIHYFKNSRITLMSLPYGIVIALVTLNSGSLLPAIVVHVISSLTAEWLGIYRHPEMRVQGRLYD